MRAQRARARQRAQAAKGWAGCHTLPNDILGVIQRFTPAGGVYNIAYDRGPASQFGWNTTAPDGVIDLPNDILSVILSFGHSCQ